MAHVSGDLDSPVPPDAILGALTDFSDRRLALWPNVDRRYYRVHDLGRTSAEVTEGSRGVWERTRYDWSKPGTVRIEVVDSNAFRPGSSWLYSVTPRPTGGSHVHYEFQRNPKNARGALVSLLLSAFGRKIFGDFLAETLHRLEREPPAPPAPIEWRPPAPPG
ncbi:MAG TPA: SRPBCC family protein [Anaeromyxobacteraceae bacterium]|nr:SRPBCC family protein [Anaeromyxobacteraceae bacterium]